MPADRHDLPALDRLTTDLAHAMRAAEATASRPRWWRRLPPLVLVLLALAVPSALIVHATSGDAATAHGPGVRCQSGATVTVGVGMLLAGATSRRVLPGLPALSRRDGSRSAARARRSCA